MLKFQKLKRKVLKIVDTQNRLCYLCFVLWNFTLAVFPFP